MINDLSTFLEMLGLIVVLIGSIIILGDEYLYLKEYFMPIDKIEAIREGKMTLLDNDCLKRDDEGFEEVLAVIEKKSNYESSDLDETPSLIALDQFFGGALSFYSGIKVYVGAEKGSRSDCIEIGTHNLLDNWLEQEIRDLQYSYKQTCLNFGVFCFVLGFSLQIISYFI